MNFLFSISRGSEGLLCGWAELIAVCKRMLSEEDDSGTSCGGVGVALWRRGLLGKSANADITLLPWCKLRAIKFPALGCLIALQGLLNAAFK